MMVTMQENGIHDAAPPPTERQVMWRAYFESSALLTHRLEQTLKSQASLTLADYNLLLLLTDAPGHRMRLGELARRLVFSPSRLTYLMKTLTARGLVRREGVDCDGRGADAVLTDAGATAFEKAAALHSCEVHGLFLDHLSEQDTEALSRVFADLGARLGVR